MKCGIRREGQDICTNEATEHWVHQGHLAGCLHRCTEHKPLAWMDEFYKCHTTESWILLATEELLK